MRTLLTSEDRMVRWPESQRPRLLRSTPATAATSVIVEAVRCISLVTARAIPSTITGRYPLCKAAS